MSAPRLLFKKAAVQKGLLLKKQHAEIARNVSGVSRTRTATYGCRQVGSVDVRQVRAARTSTRLAARASRPPGTAFASSRKSAQAVAEDRRISRAECTLRPRNSRPECRR